MAVLVVAAGLALGGCEVVGSVDIDADGVDVDLRAIGTSQACLGMEPLTATMSMQEDGRFVCHVVGRAQWQDVPDRFGTPWVNRLPAQPRDAVFLTVPAWVTQAYEVDRVDLQVSAPGPILAVHPDATQLGNTVHITDAEGLGESGLGVVGSMRPTLSAGTAALLTGAAVGLALGAAGATWMPRRRTRAASIGHDATAPNSEDRP